MRHDNKKPIQIVTRVICASLVMFAYLVFVGEFALAQEQTYRNPDGSVTVLHVDGTRTTTGIPDERYGTGGTREKEEDAFRRVRERRWKDRRGNTLEDEFTYYGVKDKGMVTTLYNPKPGGGTRPGRQTITKIDTETGKEIYRETVIYKDGVEISRTKTEVDRSGRKREYKWDPQKGYVEVVASVTPQTSRPGESSAASGFAVASEVAGGLSTTTFVTPQGKIRVNLPDDMAAGDTLSGTVIAEPQGKDGKEQVASQGELNGYVVEMEQQQASTSRILKLAIPAVSSSTYLILKDKDRKEVARIEVPVGQQPLPVEEFDLPAMGQQGRPVELSGRFDGDLNTTNLTVGGEHLEVLAESPRKVVARNTSNKIGPTEMVVEEQGRIAKSEFRSVGLKLSAPKLDLLRGEQTTLTVKVLGLEGLKESVPLVLENKSAHVISMGEGNREEITINPSQVQGGSYTFQRPLTGIQRGAYTITATVITGHIRSRASTNVSGGT